MVPLGAGGDVSAGMPGGMKIAQLEPVSPINSQTLLRMLKE
jgi:hypothetical protein